MGCQCWLASVTAWQSCSKLPHPIPDIGPVCSAEVASKSERAKVLQCYRRQFVKPVLDDYDLHAYQLACKKSSWPYSLFQVQPQQLPEHLFQTTEWLMPRRYYQAWAVVRVLGRIPSQVFEAEELPWTMPVCPLCGIPAAGAEHILHQCLANVDLRRQWCRTAGHDERALPWHEHILSLFGHLNEGDDKAPALSSARIQFVGECFSRVAEASA